MPESIQRDSWEPAGQSGQLLIYLFRCSVSLQVKVPVLVETVEIFTIGKKEGKKMLRNQTVNISAKALC